MVLIDLHNTTWFQLRQIIENDFNSTNTNLISNFLSDNQFIPTVDWNFCSNRNQLMSESARRNAMEWRRHIFLKQSQISFRPDKWASSVNEDYRKSDNTRENTNRSFDLKLISYTCTKTIFVELFNLCVMKTETNWQRKQETKIENQNIKFNQKQLQLNRENVRLN